jgi:hypothetical protein
MCDYQSSDYEELKEDWHISAGFEVLTAVTMKS